MENQQAVVAVSEARGGGPQQGVGIHKNAAEAPANLIVSLFPCKPKHHCDEDCILSVYGVYGCNTMYVLD